MSPDGQPPALSSLRWRDILPGALAFFAQPVALVGLVAVAAFVGGRCAGKHDAAVERWTAARDWQVGPVAKAFHAKSSADSATAARLLAWAQAADARADRLTDSLTAALTHRPPTPVPAIPAAYADSVSAVAYTAGHADGYAEGWDDAAEAGATALAVQAQSFRATTDSLMRAAAVLEQARQAAVSHAERSDSLLRHAPVTKADKLACGPGAGYAVTATGAQPALTVGCVVRVFGIH